MENFWNKLSRPIMALAPMADVTDAAFRRIIAKYSKSESAATPFVMWTEFVSADGLCHPVGREKLLIDLQFTEAERPIVAQLFGANPTKMEEAAALITSLGFDGLDINMGCPDRTIERQGAGAALIKNPTLAREIIRAAKRGVASAGLPDGKAGRPMPVSVKTRLGNNHDELENWLPALLAEAPAVITLHARIRKEMSKVPARWERVKEAIKIRDALGSSTLIFGNGDLTDVADAYRRVAETGADGAMLGRAIFGNPWLFKANQNVIGRDFPSLTGSRQLHSDLPDMKTRLRILLEHTKLFDQLLGQYKSFAIMKKHFKAYLSGVDGADKFRQKLMLAPDAATVEEIINECYTDSHVRARPLS